MPDRLRIALVGAGPVAERCHLPAIRGVPEVQPTFVVDVDAGRASSFAERQGFPRWSTFHSDLPGNVDIAIVALPNAFHAPVSCDLLSSGIHVLCEKPMARATAECQAMLEASRRSGALLSVGHNRRFRNHLQLAKRLISQGLIGKIREIQAEEGGSSDWPRSPAYFNPQLSGGGSLMDVGIHSIDLIRWIAGDFAGVEYSGDGTAQRVEGEATLSFRLASGATGTLHASRTRNLAQRLIIRGSKGYIEAGLWDAHLRIRYDPGKPFRHFPYLDAYVSRRPPADSSFVDQLHNLVQAVRGKNKLLVDGREGMAAVDVVCRAYANLYSSSPSLALAAGDS